MALLGESSCNQAPEVAGNDSWLAVYQADRNTRMRREQGNIEYKERVLTLVSMNLTSWRKNSMRAFELEADIVAIHEDKDQRGGERCSDETRGSFDLVDHRGFGQP